MSIGGALILTAKLVHFGQVQGVHRHGFHCVEYVRSSKSDACALGDAHQFIDILWLTFLGEMGYIYVLDARTVPG